MSNQLRMAQMKHQVMERKNAVKIIGIQFSIQSPEEIRTGSVAQINSKEGYVNNKPKINGIFDPRMGVLEPGYVCPTDGLNYMQTPGYFGHIELAKPVFYVQYMPIIEGVLKCICIKCSKLLMNKKAHAFVMQNMSPAERWDYVKAYGKGKRCGDSSDDGCNYKQPTKIKKVGYAKLLAQWESMAADEVGGEKKTMTKPLTPEDVIKIFRHISAEDVAFMGFSPLFSRPDWLICQVLAIPPPAVRPSVKQDSQQRSEDDLTHALINIIKTNDALRDKMNATPVNPVVVDEFVTYLQYAVASLIDNKVSNGEMLAQRSSGRPIKSIKERLNGKTGRVRGNLMGKRVDYSARSVITPDPNISIKELGVPLKIAMNLTTPVVVNDRNRLFLQRLVQNGPEVHPGANFVESNGHKTLLRMAAKDSIQLKTGDIVHRHIINGDAVLFNRQPTLHRMSMMCHIAKIMPRGDTFRMNVGTTKPYNADFDGDEMNMHMPQDSESEAELLNLAAVPWQLISPANNKAIIGIFQDSLVGAYLFTRPNLKLDARTTMNLLMSYDHVNVQALKPDGLSSFELLSQILPPLSLKYDTKHFKEGENRATSNHILNIVNGQYYSGQLEKDTLHASTKGIIHRICNDFGNMAAVRFIDDLQNIVTEYMKTAAFSVGVSDLLVSDQTRQKIKRIIADKTLEVQQVTNSLHLGVFENKAGNTNRDEFENQLKNIMSRAEKEAGNEVRENLQADNRFMTMVKAGSKGSDLNTQQMIACVAQQTMDNKRIPYGYEHRTLPHFTKFDDSPAARGFVANSFIHGLTPVELFEHAMGGREGLIDTAVKTSQTGYMQRRLIKGLEDLMVYYDLTVRNNKGKIVKFNYTFDTVKVESQSLPLTQMTLEEIYSHFLMPAVGGLSGASGASGALRMFTEPAAKKLKQDDQKVGWQVRSKALVDYMIESRQELVRNVFAHKSGGQVSLPVAFYHIINNIQKQNYLNDRSLVDITPLDAMFLIDEAFQRIEKLTYAKPNPLFKVLFYFYLTPQSLLVVKRFNKIALIALLENVVLAYKKALVAPGEMVGMIAAQSIGEPTTQMTLNTFHLAGVASKATVGGLVRMEEILDLQKTLKQPSCTVFLPPTEETEQAAALTVSHKLEHTQLRSVVEAVQICFDPDDMRTLIADDQLLMQQYSEFERLLPKPIEHKSKWIIRLKLDAAEMLERDLTMEDLNFALMMAYPGQVQCVYSDYNTDSLVMRIRMLKSGPTKGGGGGLGTAPVADEHDELYQLRNMQDNLLDHLVLRGVKGISKVFPRKVANNLVLQDGNYEKRTTWVLDTEGTNLLSILALDFVDAKRTVTNDIREIYDVLGIEAARQAIMNEVSEVMEDNYINHHHLSVLCDRMTCSDKLVAFNRYGINGDNIGPIAKASFERTPQMFLDAAVHAELDNMRGVSANVMLGQEGYFGTSAFQVLMNMEFVKQQQDELRTKRGAEEQQQPGAEGAQGADDDAEQDLMRQQQQDMVERQQPVLLANDADHLLQYSLQLQQPLTPQQQQQQVAAESYALQLSDF